jgi:hypothetical protein
MMTRTFLRVDLDLTALEDELVEAIYGKVSGGKIEKDDLRAAINEVLGKEMIEDEKCGKILFCHRVMAEEAALGCCEE